MTYRKSSTETRGDWLDRLLDRPMPSESEVRERRLAYQRWRNDPAAMRRYYDEVNEAGYAALREQIRERQIRERRQQQKSTGDKIPCRQPRSSH